MIKIVRFTDDDYKKILPTELLEKIGNIMYCEYCSNKANAAISHTDGVTFSKVVCDKCIERYYSNCPVITFDANKYRGG